MRAFACLALLLATGCTGSRVLFDDFSYAKPADVAANGWIIRTAGGWPGVPGAVWGPENVSFHDGALRMTSSSDGKTTRQTQICHQRKYLEGTYAARVRFNDAPASGPDGDQIVQTFYFVSPQKAPMDPDYSEIDFEYLPNGGWGHTGPTMFGTTWETFQLEPWIADNESGSKPGSLDGWHTLVARVANGKVRFFVDGNPLVEHGGRVYPEVPMSINFNLWFVRDGLVKSDEMRRYEEDLDWVFFTDKTVSPSVVETAVSNLRRRGVKFRDSVPAPVPALASPCDF